MRHFRLASPLAALLLFVATLAMPGTTVAHGYAHHEAAEHHETAGAVDRHPGTATLPALAPQDADHDHDHAHPPLDSGAKSRVDGLSLAPAPRAQALEADVARFVERSPFLRATLARGDPQTGPPPRLRGPPTR